MELLNIFYLIFIFIAIYFTFLFILLFIRNREKMFEAFGEYLPSISVVIPAWNEGKTIGKTLSSLRLLDYPKKLLKIIVVDDGSTDNTADIVKKFKWVKLLQKKNQGNAAYAKNYGLKYANTELVAFIDADAYLKKDALKNIAPYFKDQKVAACSGNVLVHNPKNLLQRLQDFEYTIIVWARKLMQFLDAVYVTPGGLSVYRTKVLKEVGGYDVKNVTEDIEIAWNLLSRGYLVKMCLTAVSYVVVPDNWKSWWKQRIRWDVGCLQTIAKYKSFFLKKDSGVFGLFVIPLVISMFALMLIGFSIAVYMLVRRFITQILFFNYAYSANVNLFQLKTFIYSNVFLIFGLVLLVMAGLYMYVSLKTLNFRIKSVKHFIELLIYLFIYLVIPFPLLLIQSLVRFATYKKTSWR